MTLQTPVHSEPAICVAVLAAGQSRRFGKADKLAQPLNGTMLGLHICGAIRPLDCAHSIVITSSEYHPCMSDWHERGFETVVNEKAGEGLGSSVALAANWAAEKSADALLICLADMPFVPTEHLKRLIDGYDQKNENSVIASYDGQIVSPPAIFGRQNFAALGSLGGAKGARELLATAEKVPIASDLLVDIDTRSQMNEARWQG